MDNKTVLKRNSYKSFLSFSLLIAIAFIYLPSAFAADQLALPSADMLAPTVEHKPSSEPAQSGKAYSITAKVIDNKGVKSVLLFYRNIGAAEYSRLLMNSLGGDQFGITLDAETVTNPGLEYYIQAEDLAGNTLLHGYSFSPLIVKVLGAGIGEGSGDVDEPILVKVDSPTESSMTSGIFSNKWVWIGLGVLAVAAASSGGGDGGGSTASSPDSTASVSFESDVPSMTPVQ